MRRIIEVTHRRRGSSSRLANRLGLAAAIAAAVLAGPAQAARPLATDDAAVVAEGACQIETWMERGRGDRAVWLNPGCNPFGSTEIQLGGARTRADGAGHATLWRVQVKQLIRETGSDGPGFAIAAGLSGRRPAGERERFATAILSQPLDGEKFSLHANLGLRHLREAGSADTKAFWAVALDREVAPDLRASAEVFGAAGDTTRWQLGVRWVTFGGKVQFDASAGSTFRSVRDGRLLTIGVVVLPDALTFRR